MTYELRPYQERAVQEAMANSFRYEAFDMGLGKTLIMLDYLKRTQQKAFVIAPLFVAQRTWPQEIKKFVPEMSHVVLHGTDKNDLYKSRADIKIMNYDGLKWLYNQIDQRGSVDLKERVLILDESTAIKNPSSTRFKAIKPMRHFFKKGIFNLSGEPMPRGYIDVWSQYFMLDGGAALGLNFSAFKRRYFWESGPPRWVIKLLEGADKEIRELVAPMTSILRAEDHLTMPESTYIPVPVTLPNGVYRQYLKLVKDKVLEYGENLEHSIEAENTGVLTGKLRQIAQGALYNDGHGSYTVMHEEKVKVLMQLVNEAQGSPILCPVYFRFETEMIRNAMGYQVPVISGETDAREKHSLLDKWDRGDIPLLLCQPQSLSHGLNMQTGGHIIVWFGRPWDLERYNQLNGRLVRPGQKHPVRIYYIYAKGTIDERVSMILGNKQATQDDFKQAILDGLRTDS